MTLLCSCGWFAIKATGALFALAVGFALFMLWLEGKYK